MKFYGYTGCGTCKKAIKFLQSIGQDLEMIPIRETPPSKDELKQMLAHYDGNISKLFNTSGRDYREQNIKSKLPDMSVDDVINLLHSNGNLIKRPFLISKDNGLVGFKDDLWTSFFSS